MTQNELKKLFEFLHPDSDIVMVKDIFVKIPRDYTNMPCPELPPHPMPRSKPKKKLQRPEDPYITRLLKDAKLGPHKKVVLCCFHYLINFIHQTHPNLNFITGYGYYINKILNLHGIPSDLKTPKNTEKCEKLWQEFCQHYNIDGR